MASAVDFKPCGLSAWGFNLIVALFVENQLFVLSLCLCAFCFDPSLFSPCPWNRYTYSLSLCFRLRSYLLVIYTTSAPKCQHIICLFHNFDVLTKIIIAPKSACNNKRRVIKYVIVSGKTPCKSARHADGRFCALTAGTPDTPARCRARPRGGRDGCRRDGSPVSDRAAVRGCFSRWCPDA